MTIATDITTQALEATKNDRKGPVRRRPFTWRRIPLHLLLIVGGVLMALPFIWMLLSSLKPLDEIFVRPPKLFPVDPTVQNYETAFGTGTFGSAFLNSVYIAAVVTLVSLLTCAMAAYAFARMRFPGNNLLFAVFLATMMVPVQLTIIPLYIILGQLRWIDTHLALIVPAALFNAFGVFLLRQYVRGIPLELEEAAAIDGASRVKIFVTMILPLLRTPMVALGIFIFLGQWNNFFTPLIFLNSESLFTLPLWVTQFKGAYSSDWGGLMAAASLAAVPFLVLFILAQRQIVEGIALSGSKT
ncbi:carbohydrate ABC transporter permease [Auraticoccus monumenti]|uniref:Carbohydrate ABC transporter membrane protein 2, CUT1 family n=1 Tax=Auraticoccus monumenti TaxID=675864 RepID=A0A1G7A5G0_9ACTN|nr:carbohydrate ABC transporter permease [Auraticoccus monumenti]SDE10010.1 carbohydrate ABC transporter membrane protein 2, CUT1 family [Auraticoccus monumenti]